MTPAEILALLRAKSERCGIAISLLAGDGDLACFIVGQKSGVDLAIDLLSTIEGVGG